MPIIWAPVLLLVFRQDDRGTGAHNMGTCPLARLFIDVNAYHVFLQGVGHVLDIYWRDLGMVSGMCSACVMYVLCLLVKYIDFSTRLLLQLVMLVFLRTFPDSN